jgi:hypothetical protein
MIYNLKEKVSYVRLKLSQWLDAMKTLQVISHV